MLRAHPVSVAVFAQNSGQNFQKCTSMWLFLAIFKKNIFIGAFPCIFASENDLPLQRLRQRKPWTGQNQRMEWLWRDFLRRVVRPFVREIQRGLQRVSVDFAISCHWARISFTLYKRTEALRDTAWNYPCLP